MAVKTLVFCWELGSGNGHMGPFEPLARRFLQSGWRVVILARDTSRVARFFPNLDCEVYQAPFKVERAVPHVANPATFAHMLQNLGYRFPEELQALVFAWQNLLRFVRPDVMVCDHSPTALLAARGLPIPKFTIGHGFYFPRDEVPLANIAPWNNFPEKIRAGIESQVLGTINQVLAKTGGVPLTRVGALFSEEVTQCLTTFRELDHNGPREADYFGALLPTNSSNLPQPPQWPSGRGPKVFAYLKTAPGLVDVLKQLSERGCPAIVATDNVSVAEYQPHAKSNIAMLDRLVAMESIRQTCDLAITNAGHGTICELLLAGVSQMLIPLTVEQVILSERVKSLGAGLDARRDQPELIRESLGKLLDDPHQPGGARAFQERYRDWSSADAANRLFRKMTGC